jgi:hypothetical protein
LDRHHTAIIAGYAPVYVTIFLCLILRYMIKEIKQVLALTSGFSVCVVVAPGKDTFRLACIFYDRIQFIGLLNWSIRRQCNSSAKLTPNTQSFAECRICIEILKRSLYASMRYTTMTEFPYQIFSLRRTLRYRMTRRKIKSEKRLQKSILHHIPHSFRVRFRHSNLGHELIPRDKQRGEQPTFHHPSIFRLDSERSVCSILSLKLFQMRYCPGRGGVGHLMGNIFATMPAEDGTTALELGSTSGCSVYVGVVVEYAA